MGAICHFGGIDGTGLDGMGEIQGSAFGEPDGTTHQIELLSGNGRMILRIKLEGSPSSVDLLFGDEQSEHFGEAVESVLRRLQPLREKSKSSRLH